MNKQIDWILAFRRARRNAWAKLNGGDATAKLLPDDQRHSRHAVIMAKLNCGIIEALRRIHVKGGAR